MAKRADEDGWERGFDGVDGAVCPDCVSDEAIMEFIRQEASETECDFCGRRSVDREPIAAEADLVLELLSNSIKFEYARVEDELAFDEGDYIGEYYGMQELLQEQPRSRSGTVTSPLRSTRSRGINRGV